MPQVSAMIERDYHVTPVLSDPDEAVAKGAAIYAGNQKEFNDFVETEAAKSGMTVEEVTKENLVTGELDRKFALSAGTSGSGLRINITNVLSRTYGVEAYITDDKIGIYNMLMINQPLPASRKEAFFTHNNNQGQVDVKIYESRSTEESMEIDGREPITVIPMKLIKNVPANTQIDMTLTLDNSGILHIMAEETLYHSKLDTTFRLSNQMTNEEMALATRRTSRASVE